MVRAIIIAVVLLSGCVQSFTKNGTTVMSYCLIGAVYMDQTEVTLEEKPAEHKPH